MLKTSRFDIINYLKTEEDIVDYLEAVVEENDPKLLELAIEDITRARKINNIPENLSKINDKEENKTSFIYNILKLFKTADESGLKLSFTPKLV